MEWAENILGTGEKLTAVQMTVRGIIVFIAALAMLRIAGKRTFGKNSATDMVIMIMLGALLSRAVTGASPFAPVLCASFAIVLFHRFLAWICLYSSGFSSLIKGRHTILYRNGAFNEKNLKHCLLSEADIMEAVRLQTNKDSLVDVKEIFIEVNGHISVIEKQAHL